MSVRKRFVLLWKPFKLLQSRRKEMHHLCNQCLMHAAPVVAIMTACKNVVQAYDTGVAYE